MSIADLSFLQLRRALWSLCTGSGLLDGEQPDSSVDSSVHLQLHFPGIAHQHRDHRRALDACAVPRLHERARQPAGDEVSLHHASGHAGSVGIWLALFVAASAFIASKQVAAFAARGVSPKPVLSLSKYAAIVAMADRAVTSLTRVQGSVRPCIKHFTGCCEVRSTRTATAKTIAQQISKHCTTLFPQSSNFQIFKLFPTFMAT